MSALLRRLLLVLAVAVATLGSGHGHVVSAHGALAQAAAQDAAAAICSLDADEAGLGTRRRVAAWTPATPAGLLAWYDFADTTHLWTDTAGTVASVNGSKFARIDDKSGNGWHATQATVGNKPTRTDAGINAKTVGTFTSAGTTHLDSAAFTCAAPCTTIVWFSGASATGYIVDSQSNARGTVIITSTPNIYAGATLASSAINTAQHMVIGLFNGASSTIRLDATETNGNSGAGVATTGFIIGAAGGATTYFDGKIGEIAIYSTGVGASDRASAEAYGTAKWGTP